MKKLMALLMVTCMVGFVTSCGTIAGTITGPLAGAPAMSEELHKSGLSDIEKWVYTVPAWAVGAIVGLPVGFMEGLSQDADFLANGTPYDAEKLLDTVDSALE